MALTEAEITAKSARPAIAVALLNQIAPEDVSRAALAIDDWLKSISADAVTLDRMAIVAGSVPMLGNVIAVVDALKDVVALTSGRGNGATMFGHWTSFGIDLIGLYPDGATAAARMNLRPILLLAQQKLGGTTRDFDKASVDLS